MDWALIATATVSFGLAATAVCISSLFPKNAGCGGLLNLTKGL